MARIKSSYNVWSKMRSALRKVWMYSPQRREALAASKTTAGMYLCPLCVKLCEKWAMDVDHIEECGKFTELDHVRGFIDRLFNGKLQAICKNCHKAKRKKK